MNAAIALIPVEVNESGQQAVSGRALFAFLEAGGNYTTWFARMTQYGFEEGQDFLPLLEESHGGRPSIDHALTLDMAKELSMIQRTERGKQAREYFIAVEKRARAQVDVSTPQGVLAMARQLTATAEQLVEAHERIAAQRPLVQQALTYQAGRGLTSRQDFAREIVAWAESHGHRVRHDDVYRFLAKNLGLFVRGERADNGNATTWAIRQGYAATPKGTADNGHNWATGKLTPKGKAYAFARMTKHIEDSSGPRLVGEVDQ